MTAKWRHRAKLVASLLFIVMALVYLFVFEVVRMLGTFWHDWCKGLGKTFMDEWREGWKDG